MFGSIKKFFGMADRSEKAADRIAETMEGIADDLQQVRTALRRRLGLEEGVPAIEDRADAELPTQRGYGRKARVTAS
jgi:hypothetical protein